MNDRSVKGLSAAGLTLFGACVLQTETVSGPKGDNGDPGQPDTSAVAMLHDAIRKLQARVDALEQAPAADATCPLGYSQDTDVTSFVLCRKGVDEVVKVGTGSSAFWIDRYEASVWQHPDGTGDRYFRNSDNDHNELNVLPRSAQWTGTSPPAFALSKAGDTPSRYITWFQANTLCHASGKRLPTGDEWLEAARATQDPSGDNDGQMNDLCNTKGGALRASGVGHGCRSAWGAEDMIGNLWEWTNEWYAGVGDSSALYGNIPSWPPDYHGDAMWNIASSAYVNNDTSIDDNLPVVAVRGGSFHNGVHAGIFSLALDGSPARWLDVIGFRCVFPR